MRSSLDILESTERRKYRPWQDRRLWIGIAALVVAVVGRRSLPDAAHQGVPAMSSDSAKNRHAVQVSVLTVAPVASPQWLEATGAVRPELEAALSAKIMGRVQTVVAKEGDRVRRNEPLILLDARDLDAGIVQAGAGLRAANVGSDSARVAARMEAALSSARIAEARAKIAESEAALHAATARLELVQAGPRPQEREQANLAVAQAKSNLDLAESNLKRMAGLYKEGAISAQMYDQYRTQCEVARSQFETTRQGKSIADEGSRAEDIRAARQAVLQSQAALEEARTGLKSARAGALQTDVRRQEILSAQARIAESRAGLQLAQVTRDYATIAAPFDGVVTQRIADPGMMAGPGVPLLKIQGGRLRLEAVVPESTLVSIKNGASVPLRFDALGGRNFTGRVVEIAPQGDAGSHTFTVKIEIPRECGASAGMFGRARFATGSANHLLVPASAVSEREGLRYLYVADAANTARLRMVTVGETVGSRVEILSGLNAGERVIAAGNDPLTDGVPVVEGSR